MIFFRTGVFLWIGYCQIVSVCILFPFQKTDFSSFRVDENKENRGVFHVILLHNYSFFALFMRFPLHIFKSFG